MARRRRPGEHAVYFPWERGIGALRGRGIARVRPFLVASSMAAVLLALGARERELAGIRSTRATLLSVRTALDEYRADHDGRCPPSLGALATEGYSRAQAVDAWQRPLRLTCPGRRDPGGYELISEGPDGEMGGLDRVE
jgi:general secretion pathway protein G